VLTCLPLIAQPRAPYSDATSTDATPVPTPDTSRPSTPVANHLLSAKAGPGGRGSRRARKVAVTSANASSGDETSARRARVVKTASKKMRRWDAEGLADDDDEVPLDYSAISVNDTADRQMDGNVRPGTMEAVTQESWGKRTGKGDFVLKDLDDEVHSILQGADAKKTKTSTTTGVVGSSLGAIGGLFRNVIGGKVLTKEDLEKSIRGMEDHLLKKNVAREAAVRLCEGVERELVGVKTGSFESKTLYDSVSRLCSSLADSTKLQLSKLPSAPPWNLLSVKSSLQPLPSTSSGKSNPSPLRQAFLFRNLAPT